MRSVRLLAPADSASDLTRPSAPAHTTCRIGLLAAAIFLSLGLCRTLEMTTYAKQILQLQPSEVITFLWTVRLLPCSALMILLWGTDDFWWTLSFGLCELSFDLGGYWMELNSIGW